jgi:glycogen synthase
VRVLLVSQEMPPETGWGGIGTYVNTISRALARKGADVHVLSIVEGQPTSRRESDGVTVHRGPLPVLPGLAAKVPAAWQRYRMPETWRRFRLAATVVWMARRLGIAPDVIECPEWMAEGFGIGIGGRVPLVVHLHSSARQLFPLTGQGRALRGFDRRASVWLEEMAARRAQAVISTPWNLAEMAPRIGLDPEALHPLWYPLEPPERIPMPDPQQQRVTFLGRFEPRKGPDVVLRAAPAVLAEVPSARFTFVGRDATTPGGIASAEWLRREAGRLGVAHAVEIREEFGGEAVLRSLREATVCAFPSRWESFGYTMAEAQGAGRPVVVSSIPALRALVDVGTTGAIVSDDDPGSWAAPLVKMLRDPVRAAAMGEAGAERLARLTDPARVADETLEVYVQARERWRRRQRAGERSRR